MSLWSRIANVVRGDGLSREIDEELQSHIAEAIEQGRDPSEARRRSAPRCGARREPRHPAPPMARFAARRRHLRLAPARQEEGDLRRGHPVAGSGHRSVHRGIPADRRAAAAALAGGGAGATVRGLAPGSIPRRQARIVRRMGVSVVPTDARRGEGSSRVDRRLLWTART
jgi:hypothetical protein